MPASLWDAVVQGGTFGSCEGKAEQTLRKDEKSSFGLKKPQRCPVLGWRV